ncbi:ATP-binding protein [Paraglaciecola aquimarina]|uniref:histidine kinase n=1 Tax=Paraglaciecola algarum TaxID=3050085 RepID=A0ABS9D735_9ALTE|nr:sensor histidine kinase [Paraglaciecola sp. G1-23]MCF2947843.1 ATP-binding protein [Paraglaciecola sp. G1-23]
MNDLNSATESKRLLGNAKSTWLLIAFIVLTVIFGNAYLAISTIKELTAIQKGLYQTSENTIAISDLHVSVLSAETGQRGYLLTEVEDYLRPYQRSLKAVTKQMERVSKLNLHDDDNKEKVELLVELSHQKMLELQETVELGLKDKGHTALRMIMTGRGKDLYRAIYEVIQEIQLSEISYRNELYTELGKIQKEATVNFLISGVISGFLLLGMMVLARLNLNYENKLRVSLQQQNEKLAEQVADRTEALTLYSEELTRSNRELEDFAFVASHDLQEPLRKIRAFGDRLKTSYAPELQGKGEDYINRMQLAAERMSNLINDLLEFSRITTRGKPFNSVKLDKLLSEVEGDLDIAIEESQAVIKVDSLPEITGDEGQLYQLFLNLLSNAVKFRQPEQPPRVSVHYSLQECIDEQSQAMNQFHRFIVEDNGIGFDQEFADKIFVPFQRLHGRSEYKGTGIGLAVCRRIVERHGGTIQAKSEKGKGAQFIIDIPVDATLFNQEEIDSERFN